MGTPSCGFGAVNTAGRGRQHFSYFQFRGFPSWSQVSVISMRVARVSGRLASVIHSMYSRRWLGLNFSHVAVAARFFRNTDSKSAGVFSGGFGFGRGLLGTPL